VQGLQRLGAVPPPSRSSTGPVLLCRKPCGRSRHLVRLDALQLSSEGIGRRSRSGGEIRLHRQPEMADRRHTLAFLVQAFNAVGVGKRLLAGKSVHSIASGGAGVTPTGFSSGHGHAWVWLLTFPGPLLSIKPPDIRADFLLVLHVHVQG